MTPTDGAASGDGPGRLDLGVIRRIRPVNLEYAGTTAARLLCPLVIDGARGEAWRRATGQCCVSTVEYSSCH